MTRRVAITGAAGQLGRRLVESFEAAGDDVLPLARPDFDLTSPDDLARLAAWRPQVVVNAAAWTDVDGCARDPARAMRINGEAPGDLAVTLGAGALLIQVSTNEVFDGTQERPYHEGDQPRPINPYGASKLLAEELVTAAGGEYLIVRTAWLHDPSRGSGFPGRIRAVADRMRAEGRPLRVVADEWGNPTPVHWLAEAVRLTSEMDPRVRGVLHLAALPAVSRYGWAIELLADQIEIVPISLADFPRDSRVPARAVLDVALAQELGITVPDWRRGARASERA